MALTRSITKLRRLLNPGSLATLGFGVILAGFSAAPAQALPANSGTDYLVTPGGGAKFVFNGDVIPYSGLPILTPTPNGSPNGGFSGRADTVVNRLDTVSGGGTTRLEIVGLSLFANRGPYHSVAGLQKYYGTSQGNPLTLPVESIGTMAIDTTTKKWDSLFTVKAAAFFGSPNFVNFSQPDVVRNIIQNIKTPGGTPGSLYDCESTYGGSILGKCLLFEKTFFTAYDPLKKDPLTLDPIPFSDQVASWLASPTAITQEYNTTGGPAGDNLVSNLEPNFIISGRVPHDAGDGTIHTVDPVPGPLPILGIGAAFSFSRRLRKKLRTAAKAE
jgi:hypothetical protein